MSKVQTAIALLNETNIAEYVYPIGFTFWKMLNNKPTQYTVYKVVIEIGDFYAKDEEKLVTKINYSAKHDSDTFSWTGSLPVNCFLTKEELIASL